MGAPEYRRFAQAFGVCINFSEKPNPCSADAKVAQYGLEPSVLNPLLSPNDRGAPPSTGW